MKYSNIVTGIVTALILSACSGAKVLKEAQPIQTTQPLATVSDQQVTAILDWVIVRDGPGTWAKNADWDEYLLRVSNLSDQLIQVTRVTVVDSLDTRIEPQPNRKQLVKGSKQTTRRYKGSGIKVKAGLGVGTMVVAGAAVTTIAVAGFYSIAAAGAAGSAAAGYGGLGAAGAGIGIAGAVVLVGPAIAAFGIVRGVQNRAVSNQIEQRQTVLPLELPAGKELQLDVFFPLAPSPGMVEVIYTDATGEHSLIIDTSTALNGLHIGAPKK